MRVGMRDGEDQRLLAIAPAAVADAGKAAERRAAPVGGDDQAGSQRAAVREPDQTRVEAGQEAVDGGASAQADVRHRRQPVEQRAARGAVRHVPAEEAVAGLLPGKVGGGARPAHPAAGVDDAHDAERRAGLLHGLPGAGAGQRADGRLQEGSGAQVAAARRASASIRRRRVDQHHLPVLRAEACRCRKPGDAAAGDQDVGGLHGRGG